MRVTFLSAGDGTPLTKTFTKIDDQLEQRNYPLVREFISSTEEITSPEEFHAAIEAYAEQGFCLLKGNCQHELHNESRAGSTRSTDATSWLCIDIDTDELDYRSVDEILTDLDPELARTDYIMQLSASAGITRTAGLSCHVFIMLAQPVPAMTLRDWIMRVNLERPRLRQALGLTASGQALRWPIDPTVAQNDKLIYIAPPKTESLEDPLQGERVRLVKKGQSCAAFMPSASPEHTRQLTEAAVAELRAEKGLARRAGRYRTEGNIRVLSNPDSCHVTGEYHARGFTYLNLNGGDSWAYYFAEDKPTLLYNFKGEPVTLLADIAPDFLADYQQRQQKAASVGGDTAESARVYTAFRVIETDTYYNGFYDEAAQEAEFYPVSKSSLPDFFGSHGLEEPESIPEWTYTFDPTTRLRVNPAKRWVNSFKPTVYMSKPPEPGDCQAILDLVLHFCGGDQESADAFIHWLAYIFQTGRKTGTAWIFRGTEGTGKGLFFSRVLRPLFGHRQAVQVSQTNFEDQFNSFVERAMILWVDEVLLDDPRTSARVMNKWKNLITEDTQMIRNMRSDLRETNNFSNMILASNHTDAVELHEESRRFNVAEPQYKKLDPTSEMMEAIEAELKAFSALLRAHEIDERRVRQPLCNRARTQMIVQSKNTVVQFFDAMRAGDLEYFAGFLMPSPPLDALDRYTTFRGLLVKWAYTAGNETWVATYEVQQVYSFVHAPVSSPQKFGRMAAKHRMESERRRRDDERIRGYTIRWDADPIVLDYIKSHAPGGGPSGGGASATRSASSSWGPKK